MLTSDRCSGEIGSVKEFDNHQLVEAQQ
jgi:hypothetical protein